MTTTPGNRRTVCIDGVEHYDPAPSHTVGPDRVCACGARVPRVAAPASPDAPSPNGAASPATDALVLPISLFHTATDTVPKRRETPWPEMVRALTRHAERPDKDGPLWSPATYPAGATRKNENVETVTARAGDFDQNVDLDATRAGLGDYEWVLHSTYSHTPDAPRVRVVVPFSQPVPADQWPDIRRRIDFHLFGQRSDPQAVDPSRMYYLPSCPKGAPRIWEHHSGSLLDPFSLPPVPGEPPAANGRVETPPGSRGPLPIGAEALDFIAHGAEIGDQRIRAVKAARNLHSALVPVEAAAQLVWNGLETSEQAPGKDQWTRRDAAYLVRHVYLSPAPPLEGDDGGPGAGCQHPGPCRGQPKPPPFPTHVLPGIARQYVEEAAAALHCPAGFVGTPLLAMVGGAVGRRVALRLKPGWEEFGILWVVSVGEPGTARSAGLREAKYPLSMLQRQAKGTYDQEVEEHIRERERERQRQQEGDAPPEDPSEGGRRPVMEEFLTTDPTMESLAKALDRSPGMVAVMDELGAWVRSFDAYRGGRGGDRQHWMSLWSGEEVKTNRARAEVYYIAEPVVCVAGNAHPDDLRDLLAEANRRDGFMERILWDYPEAEPASWTKDAISDATRGALVELFRALRYGDGLDAVPGVDPELARLIELSPAAYEVWVWWFERNRQSQRATRGLGRGVLAKMPRQVARLACNLHCLAHPGMPWAEPLAEETMRGAVELADYYLAHAAHVLAHFGAADPRMSRLASRVLNKLRREGGWVRPRALSRLLGGHVESEARDAALDELLRLGLVERQAVPTDPEEGGRPTQEWRAVRRGGDDDPADDTPGWTAGGGTDRDGAPGGFRHHLRFRLLGCIGGLRPHPPPRTPPSTKP